MRSRQRSPLALPLGKVPSAFAQSTLDIEVLNYAHTLEHLEAAFYNQGVSRISSGQFFVYGVTHGLGHDIARTMGSYIELVREHENQHVATLTQVILSLGGTPVGWGVYNLPYNDVAGFLRIAMALENTGVSAYDGAIHFRADNPALLTAGAAIVTVEARHASYFNLLNGAVPFPAAFPAVFSGAIQHRQAVQRVDPADYVAERPKDLVQHGA